MMQKTILKLLLTLAFLASISCGEKTIDKIGDAQNCLDDSTSATAQACLEKIDGINTTEASLLRCSANFITEGFDDPSRLVNAFQQIDGGGSGNATVAMMSVLTFKSKGTDADANKTFAQETYEHCYASGSSGFILIASFANMATSLAAATAGIFTDGNITADELATAIQNIGTDNKELLGTTAVAAYTASCSNGTESNTELCTQLGSAIDNAGGGSNPEAVGTALSNYLECGNYVSCP